MTQITPFQIQGVPEEVTAIAFDTYIPDEALPTIHFKYLSEQNQILLNSNFPLTQEEFDEWDDTMESLKAIVLKRLGLTTLATTLI